MASESHHSATHDDAAPTPNRVADLAACALLFPILAAAWLFGGMTSNTRWWLMLAVAVALLVALSVVGIRPRCFSSRPFRLPLIVVPLLLAILLGALQIIPLPAGIVAWLSPTVAEIHSTLGGPVAETDTTPRAPMTLSVYPAATRGDLGLLWLGFAVLVASAIVFRHPRFATWLLVAVATNGAAIACYGFVQEVTTRGDSVLGFEIDGGNPFGTFVNQNHAGGYLNLCLAAAIGSAILAWNRSGNEATEPSPKEIDFPRPPSLLDTASRLNGLTLTSMSLVAILAAGVVCSLSRGAFLGMCSAAAVTTICCRPRKGPRRIEIAVITAALIATLIVWVGLADTSLERLGSLLDREAMTEHSLLHHWPIASRAIPDFMLVGSGWGTYGYVYGMYDPGPTGSWFYRAENQYLEALVGGGACGFTLLVAALALMGAAVWVVTKRHETTGDAALAATGVFAFVAQGVCAAFDFGLFAPANIILLAALCGCIIARASARVTVHESTRWIHCPKWRFLSVGTSAILIVAGAWTVRETHSAANAESAELAFDWDLDTPERSTNDLEAAIVRFTSLAATRDGDADVHHRLAELKIQQYRLAALSELAAGAPADTDRALLWELTSLRALHGRFHALATQDEQQLEALRSLPLLQDQLVPAIASLRTARKACPLLPRVHLRLAELSGITAAPVTDQKHTARAQQIAPGDPAVWFRSGLIASQGGRLEATVEAFRRSLALSDRFLDDVLGILVGSLSPEEIASELMPPSPEMLLQAARKFPNDEAANSELRGPLLERALFLAEAEQDSPDAERSYLRAVIFAEQDQVIPAIAAMREATRLRPLELEWQYEFASLLLKHGELDEALDRARRCVRLAPRKTRYKKLLERVREEKLKSSSSNSALSHGIPANGAGPSRRSESDPFARHEKMCRLSDLHLAPNLQPERPRTPAH